MSTLLLLRRGKSTVENTVQAEFQSCSAIVSKHSLSSTPTFVRNIVDLKTEEDRSRNVLIMYITTAKMKDHFLLSGNEFN